MPPLPVPQPRPQRPLLLSGLMGSGKSTIGPLVAAQAAVPFLDLDAVITQTTGRSVPALFAEPGGEPAFRALEADTLRRLLASSEPRVISLGGGTLLDPDLRAFALAHAHVVTLTARPDTLAARTAAPGRPLLDEAPDRLQRLRSLLASRAAVYAEAHAHIRTDDRSPEDVADAVLRAWLDPTLVVPLGPRSYPVRLTQDAPRTLAEVACTLAPSAVFVVTDENVAPLALEPVLASLRTAGLRVPATVVLPPGEPHKQLPAVERILAALVESGADRECLVVALGGGVVSDVAGFAASLLLRGVRWVAMPTTLLSMVDAAVGGKTGVDLGVAKNAVGTFHQPSAVLIDPARVQSESPRAYVSGLAEVVKAAAIADLSLFDLVGRERTRVLARDLDLVREMVLGAVRVKTEIVTRDEREAGDRVLLNFGHTIGHGLEAAGAYTRLTHGEAVSLGMVAILRVGRALGVTDPEAAACIERLLVDLGLPTDLSREPLDEAIRLAALDKKRTVAGIRVVLLEGLGRPRIELLSLDALGRLLHAGMQSASV
ncbi:3-dehydroquinate synthase [Polyangium fumosum]|uniref:Shikimate kinase n=2 Tax=Polyangium fumosum TaxID=889272 RepID=A0A4U1ISA1_9BACT|nr:3-dehydroquinate synthase [Polyangium fumosum]